MTFRSQALIDSARGKPCMFAFEDVCSRDPDKTVWVHSDQQIHGKGRAEKAADCFGAYGCTDCHEHLPKLSRRQREDAMTMARDRTTLYLFTFGIVVVAGAGKARQPLPARMAERQKFSSATAKPAKSVSREPPPWRR